MGVKGSRKKITTEPRYPEPDLLVGVKSVLEKAEKEGLYVGNIIKIEDLLPQFNIKLEYMPMDPSLSGSLRFEDGQWIMCINENHNVKRRRFTIAHELGHFMLHKNKNIEFKDSTFFRGNEMDSIEYAANEFAARLLMPEEKVRSLVSYGVKNIGELAASFGVSSMAMKYRVLSLGYKMKDNG